jgi:DNA-binding GntR family transcriptional regulator
LIEEDIARQMGVSRVPVRQAIHMLERDGLVVTEPHRGASVINLSDDDIEEIYGLRIALEMYAIAQAVVRAPPQKEIDALQLIVDQMRKQASEDVPPDQNQLDLKFHETICEMSGNRKLLEAWQRLSTQIRMVLALKNLVNNDSRTIPEGHQRVVDAIRRGDAATAQRILADHIKASAKRVLKIYPRDIK